MKETFTLNRDDYSEEWSCSHPTSFSLCDDGIMEVWPDLPEDMDDVDLTISDEWFDGCFGVTMIGREAIVAETGRFYLCSNEMMVIRSLKIGNEFFVGLEY